MIQNFLSEWRFKDLWAMSTNEAREPETHETTSLTGTTNTPEESA
jgi:hypothetical protein